MENKVIGDSNIFRKALYTLRYFVPLYIWKECAHNNSPKNVRMVLVFVASISVKVGENVVPGVKGLRRDRPDLTFCYVSCRKSDGRRAIELAALRKREELERRRQELERIALQKRQEILDALKIKV